jgi:hypothetical protein
MADYQSLIRQDAEISDTFGCPTPAAFCPVHPSKPQHLFPRLSPVSMATSESSRGRPRRPVAAGAHAAIASGVTQTVRLPRLSRKRACADGVRRSGASLRAAAAPRQTPPSSQSYSALLESCDDAVHSPCTASGPSGSAGDLYTRPASSATAPAAIFAPTSTRADCARLPSCVDICRHRLDRRRPDPH